MKTLNLMSSNKETQQNYWNSTIKKKLISELSKSSKKLKQKLEKLINLWILKLNIWENCLSHFNDWNEKWYRFFELNWKTTYYAHCDWIENSFNDWKFNLVSWICLYWADWIFWIDENKNHISLSNPYTNVETSIIDIWEIQHLSIYEIEYIFKIIKWYMSNINLEKINEIYFHIPTIEYYLYIINSYNKWLISNNIIMKYIWLIKKRSDKIKLKIWKILLNKYKISFNTIQPLWFLENYIIEKIKNNEKIELNEILNLLIEHIKTLNINKNIAIQLYESISFIKSFNQLNSFSYIFAYILCNLNHNLLIIEDIDEFQIFNNFKNILKKSWENKLVYGLFLHSFFCSDNWKQLFFCKEKTSVEIIKSIIKKYLFNNIKNENT